MKLEYRAVHFIVTSAIIIALFVSNLPKSQARPGTNVDPCKNTKQAFLMRIATQMEDTLSCHDLWLGLREARKALLSLIKENKKNNIVLNNDSIDLDKGAFCALMNSYEKARIISEASKSKMREINRISVNTKDGAGFHKHALKKGLELQDTKPQGSSQIASTLLKNAITEQDFLIHEADRLILATKTWSNQFDSTMKEVDSKYATISEKYKCESQDLEKKIKDGSVSADFGSGFYVKTIGPDGKEKYHFVTAHHVVKNPDSTVEENLESKQISLSDGFRSKTPDDVILYEAKPGRIDHGNDSISVDTSPMSGKRALSVAEEGRRPQIGQTMRVSGYPAYAKKFVSYDCQFAGYVQGNKSNMAYLMNCPTAVTNITGVSGGPVTDSSGTVWGIASAQDNIRRKNYIIVNPISANKSGDLNFGFTQTFIGERCYSETRTSTGPCTIVPGYSGVY